MADEMRTAAIALIKQVDGGAAEKGGRAPGEALHRGARACVPTRGNEAVSLAELADAPRRDSVGFECRDHQLPGRNGHCGLAIIVSGIIGLAGVRVRSEVA
jgi:hypothetical protein